MKKITALIISIFMLSACANNNKSIQTSEAITTESTSSPPKNTTIPVTTTSESATTTSATLLLTPYEILETADLKPLRGNKSTDVLGCNIITLEPISESDFDFPEQIENAKVSAYVYASERHIIDEYNNSEVEKPITSPDDLVVTQIYHYDFDCDGENESIIFVDVTPEWLFNNNGNCIWINGDLELNIRWEANPYSEITVFDFGEFSYFNFQIAYGASGLSLATFDFRGEIPECIADSISHYENGVFLRNPKYGIMHQPMICNTNGDFVTLGIEKITEDDFKNHLENGEKFLDELKANNIEITELYTCGYYTYHIKGNNYELSFGFDKSDNLIEVFDYNYIVLDNTINGVDTHNLNIIMP